MTSSCFARLIPYQPKKKKNKWRVHEECWSWFDLIENRNRDWPGPGGAFGDEIIAGDDEFGDAENAFFLQGRDGAGSCDSLYGAFEGFVKFLR